MKISFCTGDSEPSALALMDCSILETNLSCSSRLDVRRLRGLLNRLNVGLVTLPASPTANVFAARQLCHPSPWDVILDDYNYPCSTTWISSRLLNEAERYQGGRDVVLLGATSADAAAMCRLRAQGSHVTVVNWPDAIDLELVWASNRCIQLDDSYLRQLICINANLFAQAA